MPVVLKDFSWDRMIAAVDAVRERARRASAALTQASVPHSIIGGHAVASWVARVDAEAVRNTADVDLLIRREDLDRAIAALGGVGFVHQNVNGIDLFLDGPAGSVRSAVHVVFAREKVFRDYPTETPDVTEAEPGPEFPVPTLDALVRMKLTSFRLKDKVHVLDLIGVGLIDETWLDRLPSTLVPRLQELLESPDRERSH
ncbi:MAG TPA: hypothetical protein VM452_02860 [Caulifigura sp.]|nr:hypothetical protein [Caulifigura sp.]